MTGVTRQKAEHEGNPLAGLTKRIRSKGMRDETGPGTSKGKGSEGHARNSALCAPVREPVRRDTRTFGESGLLDGSGSGLSLIHISEPTRRS